MEKKEAEKLKAGDKVKLISKRRLKGEDVNWIKHPYELHTKIGDIFTVRGVDENLLLVLDGMFFDHPYEKFEIVK